MSKPKFEPLNPDELHKKIELINHVTTLEFPFFLKESQREPFLKDLDALKRINKNEKEESEKDLPYIGKPEDFPWEHDNHYRDRCLYNLLKAPREYFRENLHILSPKNHEFKSEDFLMKRLRFLIPFKIVRVSCFLFRNGLGFFTLDLSVRPFNRQWEVNRQRKNGIVTEVSETQLLVQCGEKKFSFRSNEFKVQIWKRIQDMVRAEMTVTLESSGGIPVCWFTEIGGKKQTFPILHTFSSISELTTGKEKGRLVFRKDEKSLCSVPSEISDFLAESSLGSTKTSTSLELKYAGDELHPKSIVSIGCDLAPSPYDVLELNQKLRKYHYFKNNQDILMFSKEGVKKCASFSLKKLLEKLFVSDWKPFVPDIDLTSVFEEVLPAFSVLGIESHENTIEKAFPAAFFRCSRSEDDWAQYNPKEEHPSSNLSFGFMFGFGGILGIRNKDDKIEFVRGHLINGFRPHYFFAHLLAFYQWLTVHRIRQEAFKLNFLTETTEKELGQMKKVKKFYLHLMACGNVINLAVENIKQQYYQNWRDVFRVDDALKELTTMVGEIEHHITGYFAELARKARERQRQDVKDQEKLQEKRDKRWRLTSQIFAAILFPLTIWGTILGLNIKESNEAPGLFSISKNWFWNFSILDMIVITFAAIAIFIIVRLIFWRRHSR